MPLEASKTGMPIIDIKALPVDPTGPIRWGDDEGGTVKRGVERTALQAGSKPPQEWTEVPCFIFLLLFIIPIALFHQVGCVEKLYVYPVKSLAPVTEQYCQALCRCLGCVKL